MTTSTTDKIRSLLSDGETHSVADIIKKLRGVPKQSVSSTMVRLVQAGEAKKVGRGLYQAASKKAPAKVSRAKMSTKSPQFKLVDCIVLQDQSGQFWLAERMVGQ